MNYRGQVKGAVNMYILKSTSFLVCGLVLSLATVAQVQAQTLDKTGRVVGGRTGDVDTLSLKNEMTRDVGLPQIHDDINNVNTVISEVIDTEITELATYIENFTPREEVITVTVYRTSYSGGGDDGGGGDGGGDGGGGGGGGGGSGGGGSGGGSGGDGAGC